jgi:hypothetical protein
MIRHVRGKSRRDLVSHDYGARRSALLRPCDREGVGADRRHCRDLALVVVGCDPEGHIVRLNGGVGKFAPSAAATTSDVPEDAGDGAVATVE